MKLGTIIKMAKSGIGPDEIGALLEAAGMDVSFSRRERSQYREAFSGAGEAAALPGSNMVTISGTDKDGCKIEGLLILVPPESTGLVLHRKEA